MTATKVTLLFSDLVDSTALLQRVGDERAQRILHAHRQLLREALASHGGREVKWLGDGLLTTFASVADGVRCAVTIAQRARRPVAGERLGLRLGLHVGEVLSDETDWVGMPVVVARRLCERATAGQILCSGVVVELLRGRQGFAFTEVGPLALKGLAEPVAGYEVAYRPDTGAALLRHTPFTGRTAELRRLGRRLDEARAGQGGVVLLAGEPGIGKTRLIQEMAETARAQGALVLWGRCYEGEAARPFGPFAGALSEYVRGAAPVALRADLGFHAVPLTRLVPLVRERLPDVPEPVTLEPSEERVRLLDAVAQSLLAVAARVPTVLVLDDLHWADAGTVALLRHIARFAPQARLLVLGAYRDVEVAAHHPLTEALGTLPREASYEQLGLGGLDAAAVQELVNTVADREMPAVWIEALTEETSGNPFFLREVLLHLEEEGMLAPENGSNARGLARLALPETVRQVITRRLARLSDATTEFLRVAAAFTGGIDFEVARRVAGLEERAALDALDEALGAQLLRPAGEQKPVYDFTHALVRHTLYEAQSLARQVRLHRAIAEMMEVVYGARAIEHAAEIARHYRRSATLPGAERGVTYCVAAADEAEQTAAFAAVAEHLRAALDLLPVDAAERPRLRARLGLALVWALDFEEASNVCQEAATRLAEAEDQEAAANYLVATAAAMRQAGCVPGAWEIARQGLQYVGERRGLAWAILTDLDHSRREAEDPDNPGIMLEFPERLEVMRILEEHDTFQLPIMVVGDEVARDLQTWEELAAVAVRQGQIANAVSYYGMLARCHLALGNFAPASSALERGAALARRLTGASVQLTMLATAAHERRLVLDEGWQDSFADIRPFDFGAREHYLMSASFRGGGAIICARTGHEQTAMTLLATLPQALERAPGWAPTYHVMVYDAAEVLWLLNRLDHVEVIERNLRAKTLAPDFRPIDFMRDPSLAMARLCALQRRYDEAIEWFAKARAILDEQGARPLRAIVDYDEALMYARRGAAGDPERAQPLLDAALQRFRTLGMPGWIRRAETLLASGTVARVAAAADASPAPSAGAPPPDGQPAPGVTLRREGDYWTLVSAGITGRLKDMKGLHYLVHLLEHPGHEFHVLDLLGQTTSAVPDEPEVRGALRATDLPMLDATAKASYRRRLAELREDLEEAERHHDTGRAEQSRQEIETLTQQLAAAVGLGGRDRPSGSAAERARTTVTHRLRAVIRRIARQHPVLGDHLAARVRTGTFCTYSPDPERPIHWTLGR
jgi:class 3 adenylate cyclase/tetratricopeptide (TPR) repeat protein